MYFRLAWRNLWRRKRRTAITVFSISFGVALCIFFTGIADGMYGKIIEMATRMGSGHLVVESAKYREDPGIEHHFSVSEELIDLVKSQEEVVGYSLRISGPAIISTSNGTVGGSFDAVVPELDESVSLIADHMVDGRYLEEGNDVIIGRDLARKLKAKPGSKVVVTTQDLEGETVQELFRVAGIFHTQSTMADGFYIQITLPRARKMIGVGSEDVTQLGVYLRRESDMDRVRAALEADGRIAAGGGSIVPWQEVLRDLANYIAVDNASNYIFQVLLFLVILAGVLNTVLMSVMERTYEFGVMLSIGMSRARLMGVVLVECALLGLAGTGLGAFFGWTENVLLKRYPIDLSGSLSDASVGGFYLDPSMTMDITPSHFFITLTSVFAMILVVGLYPAWKACSVEPVEALHSL